MTIFVMLDSLYTSSFVWRLGTKEGAQRSLFYLPIEKKCIFVKKQTMTKQKRRKHEIEVKIKQLDDHLERIAFTMQVTGYNEQLVSQRNSLSIDKQRLINELQRLSVKRTNQSQVEAVEYNVVFMR
jgi:stress response protein SCP2